MITKRIVFCSLFRVIGFIACFHRGMASPDHTFAIGKDDFILDGKPFVFHSGEMHFNRIPREYWEHRLKMAKSMGLNTVCVYIFWNNHEEKPGIYDWTGARDAAEFCRMAQREGLWVILRPGPYVCGEWDFGGLPWWLLKEETIKVRTDDPKFLGPARRYLNEVGNQLAPLQITRGGPIVMVQVENEYGMYDNDSNYMGVIRQAMIDAGFNVPLFASNPRVRFRDGYRPDLFITGNFGPGIWPKAIPMMRSLQKTGPLMSSEYYPGWPDTWGKKHNTTDTKTFVADLHKFLVEGISFNIYMAHGGTTFGLTNGGATPFEPFTTSYDFDAPINEAGWPTEKFTACRELFSQFLPPGEKLPEVPPRNPVIVIPSFEFRESASIFDNLPIPVRDSSPRTMEHYDEALGCILYRSEVPAGPASRLHLFAPHDFTWVFLDGKRVGEVIDRRKYPTETSEVSVQLPARDRTMRLEVFVEAMGRPNFFGQGQLDRKGLHGPIYLGPENGGLWQILPNWDIFPLPLNASELGSLHFKSSIAGGPAFWRSRFELSRIGDTFLDLRGWGKGVVWVNGHCLGRFWAIGPQQTLFCPAPWLKIGENEVIVLDVAGPRDPKIIGLDHPILDVLHPELDVNP